MDSSSATTFPKPPEQWPTGEFCIDSVRRIALASRSDALRLVTHPAIGRSQAEHLAWIACSDIVDDRIRNHSSTAIEILHAVQGRFGLPERLSDRIVVAAQCRCYPAPAFLAAVRLRLRLEYLYARAHARGIGDCLSSQSCQGAIIRDLDPAEARHMAVRMADPAFLDAPYADLPLAREMAAAHGRNPEMGLKLLARSEWRQDPDVRRSLLRWECLEVLCQLFHSAPAEEAARIFRLVAGRSPSQALELFEKRAREWDRLGIRATDLLPLFSANNPTLRRKALIAFGRTGLGAAAAA
jgi:hypothetical protein